MPAGHVGTRARALALFAVFVLSAPTALADPQPAPAYEPVADVATNVVPSVVARPPANIDLVQTGGGFVSPGGVSVRPAPSPAQFPGVAGEVATSRTEYSTVVANPDGSFAQTVSLGRLNYQDAQGAWQPIDVSLVSRLVNGYALGETANDVDLRLAPDLGADRMVELAAGPYLVRIRVPGLGVGAVSAAADRLSFTGVGTDPGFELLPTPEGFEFRVVIANASQANAYHVAVQTVGVSADATPDGTIWFVAPDGVRVGRISAPTVIDAAGEIAPAPAVTTSVADPGAGAAVRTDLPTIEAPTATPTPVATNAPAPTTEPVATPDATALPTAPDSTPTALDTATPVAGSTPAPTPVAASPPPPTVSPTPTPAPTVAPSPTAAPSPAPIAALDTLAGLDPAYNVLRTDEIVVTYAIDPAWLGAKERVFPVVVDPSVCIEYGSGTGCQGATGTRDVWVTLAQPNLSPTAGPLRAGYDGTTYSTTRSEIYFPDVALVDGAVVTSATLQVTTEGNYSNRTLKVAPLSQPWPFGNGTWNNQPPTDTTNVLQFTPPAVSGGAAMGMDISPIVRGWYSRNPVSWKADSGVKLWLANESTSCLSTDPCYRMYFYALDGTATQRPKLTINYLVHQARLDFDGALGADFAPATMPAGATIHLPVTLKNDGSGFSFANCAGATTNCYKVGYRWFDSEGKLATGFTASGTADLAASLASGSTSATIDLPVLAPPNPGQYSLRLDLVWMWNAATVFASDYADPSKYFARAKDPLAQPTNVRWVGTSKIARADFPISVVAGGGTGVGETKTVSLPDGSSLGVNLYSKNLHFEGAGGVGFADLGTSVSLAYYYDSAFASDCTSSIVGACGWGTNYDEGFLPGANGADWVYRDPAGNRFAVDATADGQLVSGAGVQLDRYRATLIEDNNLPGWSGGTVSRSTAEHYAGAASISISTSATASTTYGFRPVQVSHFMLGSVAVKATGATGVGIGFHVKNESTGGSGWLYYTIGTDFTISGVTKLPLGGTISSWNATLYQRSVLYDLYSNGFGSSSDGYLIDGLEVRGNGTAGTAYVDSLRFEARGSQVFSDLGGGQPAWTANSGNATANTTDKVVGANSIRIAPTSVALSPTCANCLTSDMDAYPYLHWAWKKVGGSTVAFVVNLHDGRVGASPSTGTITYYAGSAPPAGAVNPIQVASSIPDHWIYVTRNLLEDARQVLGFFDDHDTSGTSNVPSGGPTPDGVGITGYALVAADGAYALFDDGSIRSLPDSGDQWGQTTGDEFIATYRGGIVHRFDRDGRLTSIVDLDGNVTQLIWSYASDGLSEALTRIVAPGDGDPLSAGTAQREIAVSVQPTYVRFTEQLGSTTSATGRYTQFTRATGGALTSVIPARRSAACDLSNTGATGCLLFTYVTGTALLSRVDDPRNVYPASGVYAASIVWDANTPKRPTEIKANKTGTDLFRVVNWDAASGWQLRPEYMDANGVATGTYGYARYDDLSPNGSVLVEYAPVACTATNCTSAPAAGDKLVSYSVDGIDNYATETHYRTTGNGNPVTTRRGTFAAAKVDNFADPLTAGLTAWTQSADQYAAAHALGNDNLYRTDLTYDEFGNPTHAKTPYTNPAGGTSTQDVLTKYDAEGHVIQVSDAAFLANPGFEGQLAGWSGTGTWTQVSPATGVGALALAGTQTEYQTGLFLPGESFRFQAAVKAAAGYTTGYRIEYEKPGGTYSALLPLTTDPATAWKTIAYDVTIPQDGTGRVKVIFWVGGGVGTAYVDDVALFTRYAGTAYLADGRIDTETDVLNRATKYAYLATATNPAIFPTTVTQHYVSGQPATADQNVASTSVFDAWGRVTTATDPDGVATDTVYAANMTDVATTRDGLDNATTYLYDEIGNRTSVDDPVHPATTTTYTYFPDPDIVTAPDGVRTRYAYDGVGRQTAVTVHYVNSGVGVGGVDNVKTTFANDQFGNVTQTIADVAGGLATSDVYIDATFDLLGQEVTHTVYEYDNSGLLRRTTAYFNAAGRPTATRGPINPTATASPACPGSTNKCNAVATLDMNGRTTDVTDAYGRVAKTWYDFAGQPVRTVANYVDGVYSASEPARDIVTVTAYDPADHVVAVTDVLGHTTSTTYDNLDRITVVTRPDSSWAKTVYLPSGRVDRVSRPGSVSQTDAQVGWTKNLYDGAGRQTTTITDYDITGAAQYQLDPFEDTDVVGWSAADAMPFIYGGAILASYDCPVCATGARSASVATTATIADEGAAWTLAGTFKNGHTYKARVYAKADAAMTVAAYLGKSSTAGEYGASVSTDLTTAWVPIDVTWTNTTGADATTAYFAVRTTSAQAGTFYLDDAQVWDDATPIRNAPSSTAFDAASQIVATVAPPGHAGEAPMVTTSTYDTAGRPTAITVNAIDGAATANDVNLTTTKAYDVLGDVTDETDPTGVVTHHAYDRGGRVTATVLNWDGVGLNMTNTLNVTSKIGYNDRGEPTAICAAQQVLVDGCDPVTVTNLGFAWEYGYDAAGHVTIDYPPNNEGTDLLTTSSVFDVANGGARQVSSCDSTLPNCSSPARHTDFTYDELGRQTQAITYDGTGTGSPKLRTVTTYDGLGERTALDYYENGSSTASDALTFGFDALGRETSISRSGSPITTTTYNPDGSTASRKDVAVSSTAMAFGYDLRGNLTTTTSPLSAGSVTYAWRLDGLLESRAWPTGSNAGSLTYDEAKRPTQLAEKVTGVDLAVFDRTYDKNGTVSTETQTVTGLSGDAATGTQSFTYDPLRRVLSTSLAGSGTAKSYTYDANSNRVTQTEDGYTSATTYDRTGVPRTLTVDGYAADYVVSSYGNITTSQVPTPLAPDPTAPSTPTGLTATANGRTRADLSWSAAIDNVAVTSYSIYRDGVLVSTVAGTVGAWSDFSLSPGSTYAYTITAIDAAGNVSAPSSAAGATTQNGNGGSDTTAPSVPTGVAVTAVTSKQLNVTWTAATDTTGVQGYRVYRDAALVATVGTNAFSDTGLATHSAHTYTVAAIDGAGNASAQSTSAAGTTSAPVRSTDYAYDEADRLTAITPTTGAAATLTFDALGRHLTRTAGGVTDTYTYAGESAVVVRDAPSTGTSVNAAVDATGSRLAIGTSTGGFGWALADLHGDPAGYVNAAGAGVTDATRYDPYGEVVASVSSGLPSPWGYQGRLDLANATDTDLLDFGFRPYVPDLGLFTSPDDQAGSALNPLTFNRYLYAGANPETLVDPDGHWPWDDADPFGFLSDVAGNVGDFGSGFAEGAVGAVVGTAKAVVGAGGCAINQGCRDAAVAVAGTALGGFGNDLSHDALGTIYRTAGTIGTGVATSIKGTASKVGTAWATGDFHTLGEMAGETTVVVAATAAGGAALGAFRAGAGAAEIASAAARGAIGVGQSFVGLGRAAIGAGRAGMRLAEEMGGRVGSAINGTARSAFVSADTIAEGSRLIPYRPFTMSYHEGRDWGAIATPAQIAATIRRGTRYWDPKNMTVQHVLRGGMASGKSIVVAMNPGRPFVTTVIIGTRAIRGRFIPL